MIIKNNIRIRSISWLSTGNGVGDISSFYEPETVDELKELCSAFYAKEQLFDLIGHTSNTLYINGYNCERMVSTRKLNRFLISEQEIECECGTSVRQLSIAAMEAGIKGFEGLIDLPGTVAASIYGNAGCYGCSISNLLKEVTILTEYGKIERVKRDWFAFSERSSALKRGEKRAIILSVILNRENGDADVIKELADKNHAIRRATQPEAKNSLGSIFADSGKHTLLYWGLAAISQAYGILLKLKGDNNEKIVNKRKHLTFVLLRATDVEPYIKQWNWYQWSDEKAHELFWKYVRLHQRMFTKSEFEIEIKHNSDFIIP